MLKVFPEFDIVINGLPFQYDYPVNNACVELGVNGLDLSSDDSQCALHDEAVNENMIFVPRVGATPGITNVMVRRASEVMDEIIEAEVFFAASRCLAPAPGLLATALWEFSPEEEDRDEVFYENGRWHPTPPLSGEIAVQFHEQIGEQKVYHVPQDESNTLPVSFPSLKRAAVRGCFPPHVMNLMGSLMKGGLLSGRPVRVGDQELPSIDLVRLLLAESPAFRENPVWAYGLVVEVKGVRAGRKTKAVYRSKHPPQEEWCGESAHYENVGIPLSIGAQMIARGQVSAGGVLPPELALPVEPFFLELARRETDRRSNDRGRPTGLAAPALRASSAINQRRNQCHEN